MCRLCFVLTNSAILILLCAWLWVIWWPGAQLPTIKSGKGDWLQNSISPPSSCKQTRGKATVQMCDGTPSRRHPRINRWWLNSYRIIVKLYRIRNYMYIWVLMMVLHGQHSCAVNLINCKWSAVYSAPQDHLDSFSVQGLGIPFNIASYSLLTLMIAHVTGLQVRAKYQDTKLEQAVLKGAGGGGEYQDTKLEQAVLKGGGGGGVSVQCSVELV